MTPSLGVMRIIAGTRLARASARVIEARELLQITLYVRIHLLHLPLHLTRLMRVQQS
jgi:hypothetical protein